MSGDVLGDTPRTWPSWVVAGATAVLILATAIWGMLLTFGVSTSGFWLRGFLLNAASGVLWAAGALVVAYVVLVVAAGAVRGRSAFGVLTLVVSAAIPPLALLIASFFVHGPAAMGFVAGAPLGAMLVSTLTPVKPSTRRLLAWSAPTGLGVAAIAMLILPYPATVIPIVVGAVVARWGIQYAGSHGKEPLSFGIHVAWNLVLIAAALIFALGVLLPMVTWQVPIAPPVPA